METNSMERPNIEAIMAIDGKIFAMLTKDELATLDFYRMQGRKYGVAVSISTEDVDAAELAQATRLEADQIIKRTNSRVHVVIAS